LKRGTAINVANSVERILRHRATKKNHEMIQ
jgi:hypothetical protein